MSIPLFPTTLSIPSYDIRKLVGLGTYQHALVYEVNLARKMFDKICMYLNNNLHLLSLRQFFMDVRTVRSAT